MFGDNFIGGIRSDDLGFIIIDGSFNILHANHIAHILCERECGELKGKNINSVNTLCPLAAQIKKYTKNNNYTDLNFEFDIIGYRSSGSFIPIHVYFNSTFFDGKWVGFIFLKNEEKLNKLAELLIDAHKSYSLGTLMSGFAHDFNNVFTGIISNLDLANSAENCPENIKSYIKFAESAAQRGASVVNKLQLMVGSSSPGTMLFDISELIYESVFLMRHCLGRKIKILDFEKPAQMCLVEANQSQVFQVIVNLCLNAKDAMPEGGTIRFDLKKITYEENKQDKIRKPGSYWRVTVEDTGIGIPEEVKRNLFIPFHKMKTGKKGLGLGLLVSLKIIESMGGWIEINSQEGKGTRVDFYLPAPVVNYERQKTKPGETAETSYFLRPFRNVNVLVVDDEDFIRKVIAKTLTTVGYKITESYSCSQTLNLIQSSPKQYEIILLDVNLSDGSGLEIIPKIRDISTSKIVLISGELFDNLPLNKVDADAILNKPFYPIDVLQIISSVLNEKTE
jgi:two-component system cell cycle sensor histidine kinase/response regulator CckA